MAVVRITQELIERVQKNIRQTMQAAVDAVEDSPPDLGAAALNIVLAPYKELLGQCPPEWFKRCNRVTLQSPKKSPVDYSVDSDLIDAVLVPIRFPDSAHYQTQVDHDGGVHIWLSGAVMWSEERTALESWARATNKIKADVHAAVEAARTTLEAFSTLSPALKAWPALWDLLPEDVKNKHHEVVTRAPKAAAPDVSASLDKLGGVTAQLTINKLKV